MDLLSQESVELHERVRGKFGVVGKVPLRSHKDLSLAYTPGVAQVCLEIHRAPERVHSLTLKHNTASLALAAMVIEATPERILPDPLEPGITLRVAAAVAAAARRTGVCRAEEELRVG